MKQSLKALDKDGDCFRHICAKCPGLTIEKLKAGNFDGPQIRKLINDHSYPTWSVFVDIVKNLFDK